jgi:VCBS repeat-containing protein
LKFDGSTGKWSFDPTELFNHLDSGESKMVTFQYRADDGDAKSNISTVTINIDGVNDAPDVQAHTHTVKGSDDFGHVLDGAMDPEGHTVTFNGFSYNGVAGGFDDAVRGEHGFITFTSDDPGHWSYNAFAGDPGGDDIFEYTVSDGNGGFTTGTLTITVPVPASAGSPASLTGSVEVVAVDDAPSAPADDTSSGDASGDSGSNGAPNGNGTSHSYGSNTAPVAVADEIDWVNGGISGNILANDSDLDIGDSLIVTDVKGSYVDGDAFVMGDYGFLMITSGGDFTYGLNGAGSAAIAAGTSGAVDMFEYTIQDASGAMASSYLAVHVTDGDYVI